MSLGPCSRLSLAVPLLALAVSTSPARAQALAGPEFRVNAFTTGDQSNTAVASDARGNFVVVWQGPDGNGNGVFAQRYDAAGVRRGAEFTVSTTLIGSQDTPAVASAARGDFVVVWTAGDGSGSGVFGRRFTASGVAMGADFLVNAVTSLNQANPSVASGAAGNFVVVWQSEQYDGGGNAVVARLFDASGAPVGTQFMVNTYTVGDQRVPAVGADAAGNFVVAWQSDGQDGQAGGIFAQRISAQGAFQGPEFRVNTSTYNDQVRPSVASDPRGNFIVSWMTVSPFFSPSNARHFDASGAPRGSEFSSAPFGTVPVPRTAVAMDAVGNAVIVFPSVFLDADLRGQRFDASGNMRGQISFFVNTFSAGLQTTPAVAMDAVGNFVAAWQSESGQDGSGIGVFAQRFGGLVPAALAVDPVSSGISDGNGVFEPGEWALVEPTWWNVNGASQTFTGRASSFTGPGGAFYTQVDDEADYGTVPDGVTRSCSTTGNCYLLAVSAPSTRPALHWDARVQESIVPEVQGQMTVRPLHVGDSFTDVPRANPFYRFVETLLHYSVTGGCSGNQYCPASVTTRDQMAVFVLVAKEGAGYTPPACTTPAFNDVPASSPFCRFIEELFRRGVVSGCGNGNYCPQTAVTREQMAVFVLLTLDPALNPPACTAPVFADVPASSPFCKWIEELARRGVVSGCGGGNYCPTAAVTREQMGVFISATFGLLLYGP